MTRICRMVVALAVVAGLILAAVPVLAAAPAPVTDVSRQAARVQAFRDLVQVLDAYRSGQPVDWARAQEIYAAGLQATVRDRDAEFGEQLDEALTAVLEAGAADRLSADVARQLVDKLLQKVFYLSVKHEFQAAVANLDKGDQPAAVRNIDAAIAYFEALRGTVQKRDQAYGLRMEAAIDGLLASARAEVARGNAGALVRVGAAVEYTLLRTFYLAALGYAERTPATAQSDPAGARVPMAEGWAFYQSLRGVVAAPHWAAVDAMFNPMQGDPARVSKDTYVRETGLGLAAHARQELAAAFGDWGKPEAAVAALRAGLTLQILDADLAAALGAQGKAALDAAVQALVDAALQGNRAVAEVQRRVIAGALDTLEGIYLADRIVLQVGSRTVWVMGRARELEAAPFIHDGRTMVPVRMVAEGLGARVEWLAASRTVRITLGGRVILLPVGRAEAIVDGRAAALDVPAQILDGRTFVPVRFVVQHLDGRVEWQAESRTVIIQPVR